MNTKTQPGADTNAAQRKYDWIVARLNEGRTVYLSTALRVTKISKKHLPLVRVRGTNLEVLNGKQGWLNYNFTAVSAQ